VAVFEARASGALFDQLLLPKKADHPCGKFGSVGITDCFAVLSGHLSKTLG